MVRLQRQPTGYASKPMDIPQDDIIESDDELNELIDELNHLSEHADKMKAYVDAKFTATENKHDIIVKSIEELEERCRKMQKTALTFDDRVTVLERVYKDSIVSTCIPLKESKE